MIGALVRTYIFLLVLCISYVGVGYKITDLSGGERTAVAIEGVNPEAGEAIFFGRGKCSTCHSIGERGSAIRCPNLGVHGQKFLQPIGDRMVERAKTRSKMTGKHYEPIDYIFECVGDPPAFVVPGYKAEMPYTYKPPIGLKPDDIKAVISFLVSTGDQDIPMSKILNPTGIAKEMFAKVEAAAASGASDVVPFKPYLEGNADKGKQLFWDVTSKAGCAKCHTVNDKGGKVGPNLSHVAGTRTLPYIIESVVKPSAVIVSGFDPVLVLMKDGRRLSGVLKTDADDHLEVASPTEGMMVLKKEDIKKYKKMKKSIMPGNFAEILTIEEFHDVIAYVRTLS